MKTKWLSISLKVLMLFKLTVCFIKSIFVCSLAMQNRCLFLACTFNGGKNVAKGDFCSISVCWLHHMFKLYNITVASWHVLVFSVTIIYLNHALLAIIRMELLYIDVCALDCRNSIVTHLSYCSLALSHRYVTGGLWSGWSQSFFARHVSTFVNSKLQVNLFYRLRKVRLGIDLSLYKHRLSPIERLNYMRRRVVSPPITDKNVDSDAFRTGYINHKTLPQNTDISIIHTRSGVVIKATAILPAILELGNHVR